MPSSSMCRKMFSWTTTASSITMPMARISPSIVMLLSVKPMYVMNTNVGMIEVGMASVAMSVVRQSRMNSRIVAETRTAASSRWNFTSSIDFLMNRDWSRMISVEMSGGSAALSSLEPGLDVVDDLDGVDARLLLDDQADGVVAVEPGQRAGLLVRVLGAADVADRGSGSRCGWRRSGR